MEKKTQELKNQSQSQESLKDHRKVWDCGSTLYDSFELNSLKRQLDSAIVSRTLSMPHISDRRFDIVPPPIPKKSSKISRSLNRLIKSIFSKSNKQERSLQDPCYVVYDKSGALTTIPEVPEIDYGLFSPEIEYSSLVTKTASDRFKAAPIIGISCA
ncbi:hypothetical protein HS088_TW20G00434 [Tripterygium wilfordii]|uniref:Uncharacterized protein n=1 Tax=Tripterygium wilfordii TaxID=458696 RepID=A0A7J7C7D9_TRIWF|nr:uncharacterized protein LOC119987258 [Tripterygium wilfordii]KAF5730064.1 hypothetical protein HS088_TW20G00434 [Tripterygium wilfordii]